MLTPAEAITHITGWGNYSRIHYSTGRSMVVSHVLQRLHQQYPHLIRIHKQTLVNPAFVTLWQLERDGGTCWLRGDLPLAIARRRLAHLRVLASSTRQSNRRSGP